MLTKSVQPLIRFRERDLVGNWVIHLQGAIEGDRTLCGYAQEGSCIEGEGDSGFEEVSRGKINCPDCLRIIWYCQDIPRRALAEPERLLNYR
jgi:hypothetical protein